MQAVVQPLGDGEELRLAVQHQPPVLDLRAPAVRQQRLEHLGDAAAVGGGVDVPDRAVPEARPRSRRGLRQPSRPFRRQDARQQLERQCLDGDLLHPCIFTRIGPVSVPPLGRQPLISVPSGETTNQTPL